MFSLPVLKANQPKTVVFTVFWQDNMQKKRCFGTIFLIFSARARQVKNQSFFAAFLPPLIWTQEGVKSPKIAKLHLNLTFYLSQSLPQSCNTKNYRRRSGASKCCKLRCFMNVPCILPAKKGTPPPQLKLTVLVPPERHALLHLRCGRIFYVLASKLAQIGTRICTPICQYLPIFLNVTYFGITPWFWAIRIATCCLQLHCSFFCFFFCVILETFSIRLQVVNNLANSSKLQNRLVSPFVPLVFQIAKFTPTEPIFLWPRICHLQEQLLLWSHLEISRHYKTDMKEVWWNPSIAGSKHRILEPLV